MEDTNQSKELENQKTDDTVLPEQKKKKTIGVVLVPVIIVVILAVFGGIVFWAKNIKPEKDIDKKLGFRTEDYITLSKYKGLTYELTQDAWDECVGEETNTYEQVSRKARETDLVEYNYTGYIDGKKDENISLKDQSITIGDDQTGTYKAFSDAIKGHKQKEKIVIEDITPSDISTDGSSYEGKKAKFEIKILSVSELHVDKVTDQWVKDNYFEDMGLSTKDEFYQWNKDYLIENTIKPELWDQVVNSAHMNGYPADFYHEVKEEVEGHMEAEAQYQEISMSDYLDMYGYTDESLEEEYIYNVKSELVMWQLVKKLKLDVTDEEIEQKYEDEYEEVNMNSVEEMKELYTKDEMREAVLLDKVQQYIYDNADIKFNYEIKE